MINCPDNSPLIASLILSVFILLLTVFAFINGPSQVIAGFAGIIMILILIIAGRLQENKAKIERLGCP